MVAKVPGLIHMYRCNRRKQKLAPGSRERKETCGKPLFLFHWSKFRNKHIPEPILGKKTLRQGQFPCAAPSLPFPAPPLCCRWASTYPENHEHHKGVKQVQCELTFLFNWVFFFLTIYKPTEKLKNRTLNICIPFSQIPRTLCIHIF